MSFHWYPSGCYGVRLDEIFPQELAMEMADAYSAAEHYDDDLLIEGTDSETGEPIYKPRYRKLLQTHSLSEFEHDPGDFVIRAFRKECEQSIPGFSKMLQYASFHKVDSGAITSDADDEEVLFGIGVYQFPLEKNFSRKKVPQEFMSKAKMYLWVVGG